MHPVIAKTLGGLKPQYYFRQLFFGLGLAAIFLIMPVRGGQSIPVGVGAFVVVSAILYPYSRFVYESIVGFLIGDNIFVVNSILMLFVKFMTMVLCFSFAVFIAPIGLAYLYFYHSRVEQ